MNYHLRFTYHFLKRYKGLLKKDTSLNKRLKKTLQIIVLEPYHPGLRTHKVINEQWGEVNSSRVSGDIRIFWTFAKEKRSTLVLLEIGGHKEIY